MDILRHSFGPTSTLRRISPKISEKLIFGTVVGTSTGTRRWCSRTWSDSHKIAVGSDWNLFRGRISDDDFANTSVTSPDQSCEGAKKLKSRRNQSINQSTQSIPSNDKPRWVRNSRFFTEPCALFIQGQKASRLDQDRIMKLVTLPALRQY